MTTINEAFATVAAVQQRLVEEAGTTRADIDAMLRNIEQARVNGQASLDAFQDAFNQVMSNLAGDLMALRDGRAKAIAETIGEPGEVVEFRHAAE
jgi:hypothetical protein